jgi:tRNA pseudouridine32 synthase/23S rRNA pseudouridine746 synthase
LQESLINQIEWEHNFGLNDDQKGLVIGKMFGVLVVQNKEGFIGYLAAFSGKLGGVNHLPNFVPPVFDILEETGFFRQGEIIISEINTKIEELENREELISLKKQLTEEKLSAEHKREVLRLEARKAKTNRKVLREKAKIELNETEFAALLVELGKESVEQHYAIKDFTNLTKVKLADLEAQIEFFEKEIKSLKEERKLKSSALQNEIFEHYNFLNQAGQSKNLTDIFKKNLEINPPAGAGECAAPKLLQYAFAHDLKPISIAEFWWGESPDSEIRKHGSFYPACRGKCEPILSHMLQGIEMDENPMLTNPAFGKELETIFEDEYLVVINKPTEFLSVPGKNIQDSVYDRMKLKYPESKGPLIVHRLDMSTSGLMIISKTKEVHKTLQRQFLNRIVKKQYVALLDGNVEREEGVIELPLRVDLENRPQQLVCFEHGKRAYTKWKVLDRLNGQTRIQFSPITGRTHQLRVHAAHIRGLNCAIVGDDLYGIKADRLYLHAESIEFLHPITKERMVVTFEAEF